jgi:hypothetical protein
VNYNKFSLHSSRASTPSWVVEPNSNLQTGSENQTLKQAKIIKSYERNNGNNRKVTFESDLNHKSVSEEQIQTAQSDDDLDKNVEKVKIYKITRIIFFGSRFS